MEILIDGTRMPPSGSFGNLEEILQEILENQISERKTVWAVRLNGENYSEKAPHDARQIKTRDISTLEIDTMDKTEIWQLFLENGDRMLDTMCKCLEKISGLFRTADEKEANRHFIKFLDSYQDLIQMFRQGEDILNLDFKETLDLLEKLSDEIIVIQEKGDWIMLADLLEYELSPVLKGVSLLEKHHYL